VLELFAGSLLGRVCVSKQAFSPGWMEYSGTGTTACPFVPWVGNRNFRSKANPLHFFTIPQPGSNEIKNQRKTTMKIDEKGGGGCRYFLRIDDVVSGALGLSSSNTVPPFSMELS